MLMSVVEKYFDKIVLLLTQIVTNCHWRIALLSIVGISQGKLAFSIV